VDFERELVIGISEGRANSPAETLELVELTREGTIVTFVYRRMVSTGDGVPAIQVPLALFIAVPRPANSVQFIRRQ
jgi:hypothetical protein